VSTPEIEVFPDAAALSTRVAARLLERLAAVQAEGRVPQVVLTGGTIADEIHREVARQSAQLPPGSDGAGEAGVDWSRVELWWGDERFVPADDGERNAGQARRAWLDHVGLDPARVHEAPAAGTAGVDAAGVTGGAEDVAAAAASYAVELQARGPGPEGFDVVMLGIGPDGHIASLFPGQPALDVDDALAVPVTGSPKPPPERVSLTYRALNDTRAMWFLVSGDGKADAAARALGGADRHDIPAAGARGRDETVWFLDEPAASRL
jgi:6-phosphogluconolactonase